MTDQLRDLLRLSGKHAALSAFDPSDHPGFDGNKAAGKEALAKLGSTVSDLQERFFAESRMGSNRSILLVLQGMDTSGKGGVVRHCAGLLDPQGVSLTTFKAPTEEERQHDFLWRIEKHEPAAGMVHIFDRSQYEDVLIARVRELASADEIERRYGAINDFEQRLSDTGTTVIKCFLHISADKQRERLLERLDDPTKHWKFNPGDIDERKLWSDYQAAYEIALNRCNTEAAPWFVVPSDRKWYRNWAITRLLIEHLQALDPQWPKADYDIDEQKARLVAS